MKLLLVDNDRDLIEMLSMWLKTLGYEVYRAYTLEYAQRIWEEHEPDLVIMETAMEDKKGLAMCQDIRTIHNASVLALTKERSAQDEIRCLEEGADDYLRQPFLPSQLLAHIHALSRRGHSQAAPAISSVITVGAMSIDAAYNTVTIDGRTEYLTSIEHKLLRFLAMNANNVCTGNQIISSVWGYNNNGDTALIKTHIRHLRQKIEKNPNEPLYLLTVRGVGYSLVHRFPEESDSREVAHALQLAA